MQVLDSRLRRTVVVMLVSFCAACGVRSPQSVPVLQASGLTLSPRGLEAYERLLVAPGFTSNAVGYGGTTPDEVIALRRLAQEPNAAEAFSALEQEATMGGRLYALCGLYYADTRLFELRVEPYRTMTEKVPFLSGCVGGESPVNELVEVEGSLQLETGQSAKQWFEVNTGTQHRRYDFLGGGWPSVLVKGGGFTELRDPPYSGQFQIPVSPKLESSAVPIPRQGPARIVFLSDEPYGLHIMESDGSEERTLVASEQSVLHFDCGSQGIAYVCDPDDSENFQLFVRHPDRAERTSVDRGIRYAPSWLPGGDRLSFMNHAGRWMIRLTPAGRFDQSEELAPPTETRFKSSGLSVKDGSPTWSPDGQTVVFASNRAETSMDLYTLDMHTRKLRRLTEGVRAERPKYSPDGTHISFHSGEHLYLVSANGEGLRRVTSGVALRSRCSWFPDSKRIAFVSGENEKANIWVLDLSRGVVDRLTANMGSCHSPAISLQSDLILFVSNRDGNDEIYVMNSDGSGVQRLTHNEVRDAAPAWLPR